MQQRPDCAYRVADHLRRRHTDLEVALTGLLVVHRLQAGAQPGRASRARVARCDWRERRRELVQESEAVLDEAGPGVAAG